MKKRLIAAILAVCVTTGTFAGCSRIHITYEAPPEKAVTEEFLRSKKQNDQTVEEPSLLAVGSTIGRRLVEKAWK